MTDGAHCTSRDWPQDKCAHQRQLLLQPEHSFARLSFHETLTVRAAHSGARIAHGSALRLQVLFEAAACAYAVSDALQPCRIVLRMTAPARSGKPPPYSSGMSAARNPAEFSSWMNCVG
jgi:hypothetical protein